jgi:hypothetical protein
MLGLSYFGRNLVGSSASLCSSLCLDLVGCLPGRRTTNGDRCIPVAKMKNIQLGIQVIIIIMIHYTLSFAIDVFDDKTDGRFKKRTGK